MGLHPRPDPDPSGPLKWLSVVDEFTRECLALEADRSITSEDVIDVVMNLFCTRGVPGHIRSDNGPEFIAEALRGWLSRSPVQTLYLDPGLRGRTDLRRRFTVG